MRKMYVIVDSKKKKEKDSMELVVKRYMNLLTCGYPAKNLCVVIGQAVYLTAQGVVDPDDIRNSWYFNQEEEDD